MLSLGLNQSVGKGGSSPLKLPAEFFSDSVGFSNPFKVVSGSDIGSATTPSGTPPITMTNVFEFDSASSTSSISISLGKAYDELYVQFYLNLVQFPTPASSGFSYLMQAKDDPIQNHSGLQAATIRYQALGTELINMYSQPSTQGFIQSNTGRNTWYKVGIWFQQGNNAADTRFYINGVQRLTGRAGTPQPIKNLNIHLNVLGNIWQYYGLTISETGFLEPDGL